ncbi:MAG: 2-phospho-L-lactate transferase [Halobacteria archaeon]
MKVLVLSGGTGTPKLLLGLRRLIPEKNVTVIANVGEDLWISGNLVSPDIDSILYLLSGQIDARRMWGVKRDTFATHRRLAALGWREPLALGDLDRATHIARSEGLRSGLTLTQATAALARKMGVKARVLPATNGPVATLIRTPAGEVHFQEFWVARGGRPRVLGVRYATGHGSRPTPEVLRALRAHDTLLIGPSNPATSIGPILAVLGRHARRKRVVAVSPIVGNRPVSGPAGKLLRGMGYPVSPRGLLRFYGDRLGVPPEALLVDPGDADPGAGLHPAPLLMKSPSQAARLARRVLEFL